MKKKIVNQYQNRYSTKNKEINLHDIIENIRSKNINQPKADRKGIVFCTTSTQGRKHEDILSFTGLLFIDVDDCTDAGKVKNVFKQMECTVATWYSTSGNVHALIKIPKCETVEEFKRRYKAFSNVIEPLIESYGLIDTITSNPAQLAFESYDPDIYVNDNPLEFEGIESAKKRIQFIEPLNNKPTTAREQWIIDWLTSNIRGINTNGYPQLLRICKTLGGYCSGGYINQNTALETLRVAIYNNEYFNSNESSGSLTTYQKGGKSAFEAGLNEPIFWD